MLVSPYPSAFPPSPTDQSHTYSPSSAYSPLMDDRTLNPPHSPTAATSSPNSTNTSPLLHPNYHYTSPPLLPNNATLHMPHDINTLNYPHSPTAFPLHTPYNSPQPAYSHLSAATQQSPFNPYYSHSTLPPTHYYPPHQPNTAPALLQPAPSQRPLRNLHVDNLPPVSEARLRELFTEWGRIVRVRVVRDEVSGVYGGYGFVMYEKEEEARLAIERMDGQLVFSEVKWEGLEDNSEGHQARLNEAAAAAAQQADNPPVNTGGSGSSTESSGSSTPAEVAALDESTESTTGTSSLSSPSNTADTAPSTSTPLPPFTPPEDATHNADGTYTLQSGVLLSAYGQIGKCLRVTLARQKKPPHAQTHSLTPINQHSAYQPTVNTNLYIAGLPVSYNKQQLDALFTPFGVIVESRILLDRQTGNSRGVGFVRYENQVSCNAAIRAWNGRRLPDAADYKGVNGVASGRGERNAGAITVRYATDRNSAMAVAAAQQAQQAARRAAAQPPPSPLDMQTLLQNLQMHQLYPFLPPLSPVSPPTSPHPYSPYSPPLPLHYSPPSPNPLSPLSTPVNHTADASTARIQDITPSLLLSRLPPHLTEADVWQLCAQSGSVVAVESGANPGESIVRMERDEDVATVVDQLDGLLLAGEGDGGQQQGYQVSATKL